MARKKAETEKEITVLSEEEQPYELPEGWIWERLGNVYQINPKNNADNEIEAAFVPMSEIEAGFGCGFNYELTTWEKAKKGHTQFADGDVAFAKISPCFENRKSFIAKNLPNGIGAGTTELIILRNQNILSEYTYRFITSEAFISDCKSTYSGTVGQQRIDSKFVKDYLIPIPPKEIQQKIVDIIESLFTKLDKAKEKVQSVLDGSELRRNAILHKAFSGELTKKWREENTVCNAKKEYDVLGVDDDRKPYRIPETWICTEIKEILDLKAGKNIPAKNIYPEKDSINEYACYGGNGIRGYVDKYSHSGEYPIIGRQGALCGNVHLARGEFYATEHAVVVSAKKSVDLKWIASILSFMNLNQYATATAQPGLAVSTINHVEIAIAPLSEQQEIVRLLDSLLTKEATIKSTCEKTLATIDTMKQSILAKAFRGELGTRDLADLPVNEVINNG